VLDETGGDLRGKRVIDLGCLEGGYAAAFAIHGAAYSLGVDARKENIARCQLVKESLQLPNLEFECRDIRNLGTDTYGSCFDVVFAAGILYHLDDPFSALESMAQLCSGFLLLDTHVAEAQSRHDLMPATRVFWGRNYQGGLFVEHPAGTAAETVERDVWASYGNHTSFWIRKPDLIEILEAIGFSTVDQVPVPPGYHCGLRCPTECRVLLVARGLDRTK